MARKKVKNISRRQQKAIFASMAREGYTCKGGKKARIPKKYQKTAKKNEPKEKR